MFDRFKGKKRRVVVGVKDDETAPNLIRTVASFANRSDMTVRLITVIEPWSDFYSSTLYPGEYVSSEIASLAQQQQEKEAREALNNLSDTSDIGNIESNVIVGSSVEGLRSEALTSRASLICCGFKPVTNRFVPVGFSTAMSLMSDSSIPVLAIPEGQRYDFSKTQLTILVADDLLERTSQAVSTACELANSLGQTELIHYHVHQKSKAELQKWADTILEAMVARNLDYDSDFTRETIVEKTENDIKREMSRRAGGMAEALMASGTGSYQQKVDFGKVLDGFTRVVEELKPDIIVFGRHKFAHTRPFSIGKIPFHAMLNLNTPVLVVPNTQQLA